MSILVERFGAQSPVEQDDAAWSKQQASALLVQLSPTLMGQEAGSAEEVSLFFSAREGSRVSARNQIVDLNRNGRRQAKDAAGMLEMVPDIQRRDLDALVAQMHEGSIGNQEQLAAYLERFLPEVCHQYVALAYARGELEKRGSDALLSLVDKALAKMQREQGQAIALGLEIGPLAHAAQQRGAGELGELRNQYRGWAAGGRTLSQFWEGLRTCTADTCEVAVSAAFMFAASELNAQQGGDKVRLQMAVEGIGAARVIKGLMIEVQGFFDVLAGGKCGIRPF